MSNTSKIIIGIIVVAVAALIIWMVASKPATAPITPANDMSASTSVTTGSSSSTKKSSASAETGASSTTSIDQDVANIDAQMSGLRSDNASADQSMSTN